MTPQKTTIDWFRVRTQCEPRDALEAFRPMFGGEGAKLHLKHQQRGILGFQRGAALCIDDLVVGRMDWGGESQRGWVRSDIPGTGCAWVKDWTAAQVVEALPSAQVRRLDIALTTWRNEINHEVVGAAHAAGRFVTKGRPPDMRTISSSNDRAGRTHEVGQREKAPRFFRGYEKGYELASKFSARSGMVCTHIEGFPVEDIYRCEVELKASGVEIPFEAIERRDQYFAGSYPFCADVLPGVECDILQRRPERAPQADLAVALENCRIQYGSTLFTALQAYHGDIGAVLDKVIGKTHNQALLEAGVLLVDHD